MGLALLVFAMAGSSDGAIDADSTNWENSWEGDVAPPAGWGGNAGGSLSEWTLDPEGYIRFEGATYGGGIQLNSGELDRNTNDGAAVEWRFRHNSGTTWFDIGTTNKGSTENDVPFARFIAQSDRTIDLQMLNGGPINTNHSVNTPPEWTTLRAVFVGSGNVEVFKDGDLVTPFITNAPGFNDQRDDLRFTFWNGANSNQYDLDYIRWTDGNPIPEPSTFAMMSIAALGLGLFRRRRRVN
tara:strand:+ start:188 stop:907 length:720 start_codon:yes stop_codon:yes gene_type:complete